MNTLELRAARARYGYSGAEMARILGLKCRESYYQKERGKCNFSLDQVMKIANELNLSMGNINTIFFDGKLPEK